MFAVLQFPIVDMRCFVEEPRLCLKVPNFPRPKTWGYPEFVRCFGPAIDRRADPDPGWSDEAAFCSASRALRFVDFGEQRLGRQPLSVSPSGVFRRLFKNEDAVARVEIGITDNPFEDPPDSLEGSDCLAIALDVLNLPTKVALFRPGGSGKGATRYGPADKLARQGDPLARLYLRAAAVDDTELMLVSQRHLVCGGRPMLILEFDPSELVNFPRGVKEVASESVGGAKLGFLWLVTAGGVIGTWILRRDKTNLHRLRNLRLCLLRLHAEREALDLVINALRSQDLNFEPGTESGHRLEHYLNRTLNVVQRPTRFGISQSAILSAFDVAESVRRVGDDNRLLDRYHGARRQVWLKVDAYERLRGGARTVNVYMDTYTDMSTHVLAREEGVVVMEDKREVRTGSTYNVDADQSQIGAIGDHATGTVSGTLIAGGEEHIDPQLLGTILKELYAALGQAGLPPDLQIRTQMATGTALGQGVGTDKINPAALVEQVKQVGNALTEAKVVVEKGSSLWESVQKLAPALAPLVVGGARAVGAWFGVTL